MQQFIGQLCKVFVDYSDTTLIYTALIESVTPTHLMFTDKYGDRYAYKHENIIEIKQLKGDINVRQKETNYG